MNREPAAIIGIVSTAVASILTLVVTFGVNLSQDQIAAILAVVASVGPIVVALLIRPKVYSPATTDELVVTAARTGLISETTTRRDYREQHDG